MFKQHEFYGSATVGERGQVVLPAKLRKEFDINQGDKLLVIGNKHMNGVLLVKAEVLGQILEHLNNDITEIMKEVEEEK